MTSELFRRELKPGMVVLDLGAHIGYFALLAAKLVGEQGKVYAFEPLQQCCRLLSKSVRENGLRNVEIVPKGASNRSARIRMGASWRMIEVVALDEFFGNPQARVDFIKMDIDGAELFALEGMKSLIRRSSPLKMVLEYDAACMKVYGVEPAALLRPLEDFGFRIQSVCHDAEGREAKFDREISIEEVARGMQRHANLLLVSRSQTQ